MPSNARKAFDENLVDIEHLLDFYRIAETLYEEDPPEDFPKNTDVVLRSAIVLLITYWEAYIEDITSEAIINISKHIKEPDALPKDLKKSILKELESESNELAMWNLTGDGWRNLLTSRLESMRIARNRSFNTPKSQATRDFISSTIGIPDITQSWSLQGMSPQEACNALDALIEIRGKIAHRGRITERITIDSVEKSTSFIKKLVSKTGGEINKTVEQLTGTPLWKKAITATKSQQE